MSSRRERVPLTGRRNEIPSSPIVAKVTSRPVTASMEASSSSARRRNSGGNVVNDSNRSNPLDTLLPRSARSNASEASELSTAEILRRLREKSDLQKRLQDQRDIDALGEYNAFSRPRPSTILPHRSVFLDPSVNNFPPSKTRTELMKKIRITSAPHPSYDLDMDGYVSQDDYRLAKRFDFDGNGVLDPEERAIGKRVLADEFFRAHAKTGDLAVFGPQFATQSHKKNVDSLANAYSFERAYERLLSVERTVKAGSSEPILSCMRLPDDTLTKHNFYINRYDCTAWNDFDAIPRAASTFGLDEHGGSRKRLLFSRRQATIESNQAKLDIAEAQKEKVNTKRKNLITNVAFENS